MPVDADIHPHQRYAACTRVSVASGAGQEYYVAEVRLTMFDSLEEQIRRDEKGQSSTREKVVLYLTISAVSVLIFGGLIIAVQHLQ